MIITTPIYFLVIEGDVKQQASQLPTTIIASYENYINKTYVVVGADENNYSNEVRKMYSNIHTNLNIKDIEITYSLKGIDFKYGR